MNRFHEDTRPQDTPTGPVVHDGAARTTAREERAPAYTVEEAERDITNFQKVHAWDPNIGNEKLDALGNAVKLHDSEAELSLEQEITENSPYPEVVAAVQPFDDQTVPANTVRAWVLGLFFVTIGSGLNVLFSMREPSISIGSLVAQLVSYPVGMFWAKVMPKKQFNWFGLKWTLNPGPFNKKEHALIVIMANVTFANGAAYSTLTVEAQRGFYNINYGFGFAIMFTIVTQMTGLGLAGLVRQFLVYPSAMMWPVVLPNCALFNTLHDSKDELDPAETNGWKIPRFKFFLYVLVGGFVWYWFPGYLFTALNTVAWVTWIKPKNVLVNQIFGGYSGYSVGAPFTVFTLDWTVINGYLQSPLVSPWHSIANTMIGLILFTWFVSMGIHYTGTWYSEYLPISTSRSYDNTGKTYKIKNILTPDYRLDVKKYKEYSPLFLSTTFALQYGLSFASIMSVVVHVGLFHGKEIWLRFRASREEPKDIHRKLYEKYPEVPMWWFIAIFLVMIGMGIATVRMYDLQLPIWGYLFGVFMAAFFIVPIGMIYAITNISIGLNVITELIISYWLPGRPMAMMVFKTLGYITMNQGITYAMDQKLAMYMKVPPRTIFWGQFVASLWSCFVQVGVLLWAFANIPDICTEDQKNHFTCPGGRVFFNASIIWGVIGPSRMFSKEGIYGNLQYFWIAGAVAPVIFWFMAKKFPRSGARFLNAPIIFGGTGMIPPAVPMNYLMWGLIGFIFNKVIRSRARGWWLQYNYILSASLDAGLAFGTIVIFFALTMTSHDPPKWWGNTILESTSDFHRNAVKKVPGPGQTFGPPKGSW